MPRFLGMSYWLRIKMNILKKIIGAAVLAINIPRFIPMLKIISNGSATPYEMGQFTDVTARKFTDILEGEIKRVEPVLQHEASQ